MIIVCMMTIIDEIGAPKRIGVWRLSQRNVRGKLSWRKDVDDNGGSLKLKIKKKGR